MPQDLVTDLRVIDVGGAGATYKIQNKGSILSAYRKNIHQNQTPKAQQQEQKTPWRKMQIKGKQEGKPHSRAPAENNYQSICCWEKGMSAKAKCLKQDNLLWSTHSEKPLTLRGLSTYVGAVVTFEGSLIAAEGLVCCCCSSSVLKGEERMQ